MEVKITIAQPYPVIWNWKHSKETEVIAWMRENVKSKHEGFFLSKTSAKIVIEEDHIDHRTIEDVIVWLFECPRDAMLFKLTWGGT